MKIKEWCKRNKFKIIIYVIALGWVLFLMVLMFVTYLSFRDYLFSARDIIYEGQVTAVSFEDKSISIYLNDEQEIVEISGAIQFKFGKEYRFIVDGNGKLIDAEIIGE